MTSDTPISDDGVPAYWFGPHQAPNFSRRVAQANESVDHARRNLMQALKHAYPAGREVEVVHHRGRFLANVTGWEANGCRVYVRNIATGKCSKWWSAHVQLVEFDATSNHQPKGPTK